MSTISIRTLCAEDWAAVKEIYEQGIATGIATFETAAPSWEKWDSGHLPYARLVAAEGKAVIGWAALSPVNSRCVYRGVAEVSVYISPMHHRKGVGKALLEELIRVSEQHGIWTLQSGVFRENTPSVKLHEMVGFRVIGYRERVAQLNGAWKDNYLLERRSHIVGV